jgi:hypothetical protein
VDVHANARFRVPRIAVDIFVDANHTNLHSAHGSPHPLSAVDVLVDANHTDVHSAQT